MFVFSLVQFPCQLLLDHSQSSHSQVSYTVSRELFIINPILNIGLISLVLLDPYTCMWKCAIQFADWNFQFPYTNKQYTFLDTVLIKYWS